MEPIFLTTLNKGEYVELLKETFREVLIEKIASNSPRLPEILNIQQVSEFLHLAVASVYEKTSKKQIPILKKEINFILIAQRLKHGFRKEK